MQDMTAVEEQERLRAEFLAMVSHELRMPLTSILGAATALQNAVADLDPPEMRQFHRIIIDRAEHMRGLIGDLLDLARIETGVLPVDPEPAEVATLVDRARNAFTSAGGRNELAIDVSDDLPLVTADRRRIVQVIGNLLSNAARNSSEDSVIRGERGALRGRRRDLGGRPGTRDTRRRPAGPVPQILPQGEPRRGRRHRPGAGHLQGDSGGPRGPHPCRERRARPGSAVRLHPAGGPGGPDPPLAPPARRTAGSPRERSWWWTTIP